MASILAILKELASIILAVLPLSPFQPFISEFSELPYLGYLNWFIPISDCIRIGLAWLGAIALFYLYAIVMRWVKMIGD